MPWLVRSRLLTGARTQCCQVAWVVLESRGVGWGRILLFPSTDGAERKWGPGGLWGEGLRGQGSMASLGGLSRAVEVRWGTQVWSTRQAFVGKAQEAGDEPTGSRT